MHHAPREHSGIVVIRGAFIVVPASSVPTMEPAVFIPTGTDAPLYHPPVVTLLLIVGNGITFWLTGGGALDEGWILQPGHLNPAEWFTSAFLHFGVAHLVVNMIFLWTFGLIVEGKIGWWQFALLYAGICAVDGLICQIALLGYTGFSDGAGGASGAIFGLMAIALLWAPLNEIEVHSFLQFGMTARSVSQFDVPVNFFAVLYIGMNVYGAWSESFGFGTPMLHLAGALSGAALGYLMLHRGWVDCEGWDLFSVARGEHRHRPEETSAVDSTSADERASEAKAERRRRLESARRRRDAERGLPPRTRGRSRAR